MIRFIKSKDKLSFIDFCINYKDTYFDKYITKDKKRIFLSEYKIVEKVFNNILKKGDIGLILEEKGAILGLVIITGYADKFFRKYIKLLSSNYKYNDSFFKYISWNFADKELFIKIKKTNPLVKLANKYHWIFKGNRGEEILFLKPKYKKIVRRPNDNYHK